MLLPLGIGVIAFAGGLYLASRLTGERSGRVVDVLGGAAATVVALNVYLTVRAATADVYSGSSRGEAIAYQLIDLLWQGATLLAAAAVVHHLVDRRERG